MVAFTDRAVAFLDVLGFKELIKEAESNPSSLKLDGLITVLESHVKFDNESLTQMCRSTSDRNTSSSRI